jgi:hypothetical protein
MQVQPKMTKGPTQQRTKAATIILPYIGKTAMHRTMIGTPTNDMKNGEDAL